MIRPAVLALAAFLALPVLAVPMPAEAVNPDEVLADPALEARARDISKGLRCLVCRNESIDESNASLARDLRLVLRERLVAGDSDAEAVAFLVDRYGEYVLLKPRFSGSNWLLWAAGPIMLLVAGGVAYAYLRGRAGARALAERALSEEEEAQLRRILEE